MAMFKTVAEGQLALLWCISLIANAFRILPENPTTNCGTKFHQRVILTFDFQVLTALIAAVLLLVVWMVVSAAESNAITALRMAAIAAESKVITATHVHARVKAFDALHGARAARVEGVGCITAKWCRTSLRGTLLLAVVLSAASCLLAFVALEEWCLYWTSCDSGYTVGSPLSVLLMVLMVLIHGSSAWIAVSQN